MTFLNKSELYFCSQLNGFKYFYLTQIFPFTINDLFAYSQAVSSIAI